MKVLIKLILNTLAVLVAGYIIPGIAISSLFTAIVVAIVLGIINTFLKPILVILTLPINVITLGLFTLFINAGLVLLASSLITGFIVEGFLSALLFSIALAIVSGFLRIFEHI